MIEHCLIERMIRVIEMEQYVAILKGRTNDFEERNTFIINSPRLTCTAEKLPHSRIFPAIIRLSGHRSACCPFWAI